MICQRKYEGILIEGGNTVERELVKLLVSFKITFTYNYCSSNGEVVVRSGRFTVYIRNKHLIELRYRCPVTQAWVNYKFKSFRKFRKELINIKNVYSKSFPN